MKSPKTGEFVMFMHTDDMRYKDPHIGYASSKKIDGEYEFHGAVLYDNKPIKRWDMGSFSDTDGKGYLLIHGGIIYELSEDYKSIKSRICEGVSGKHGESPAMFKKNGLYYFLFSGLTSWEKNDNFYYTSPSIDGEWEYQGLFVPQGSLTYNSQTTFVLSLIIEKDTVPMFMGDRWSFPLQGSSATYVWLPMQVHGKKLYIPEYLPSWDIKNLSNASLKSIGEGNKNFDYNSSWIINDANLKCNIPQSKLSYKFEGRQDRKSVV